MGYPDGRQSGHSSQFWHRHAARLATMSGLREGRPAATAIPTTKAAAYEAFQYSSEQILRRLRAEPNLLQRSIAAMRADATLSPEERAEMLRAESDLALMREVMTA